MLQINVAATMREAAALKAKLKAPPASVVTLHLLPEPVQDCS
jgi:hypothetical protein